MPIPIAEPPSSDAGPEAPLALAGKRVLLVEDNEFNQLIAIELLADIAGMEVTLAQNGQEALDRLGTGRFDVVLMDVQMPLMDGYETTETNTCNPGACESADHRDDRPRHGARPGQGARRRNE